MKIVKKYKGFKIKEVTERDKKSMDYSYPFYIYNKDNEEEFGCDSIDECKEWIDSY